jgi:hypothetical protein
MAAKQGPNVLFCMPNRTKCILLVSVHEHEKSGIPITDRGASDAGGRH